MYCLAKPVTSNTPFAESGIPVAMSSFPGLKLYRSSACRIIIATKVGWPAKAPTVTEPLNQMTWEPIAFCQFSVAG